MKKGWVYKKLGDLYPIVMGKTPPRNVARFWDTKKETHNLWVSIADLSKNEGKEIFDTKEYISDEATSNITKISKGSLLVSFKLTLGKMAFAGDDLYTNEAIMSLGKREDVDLRFLYYYFSSLDWGLLAAGNEKVKGKTLNKKSLGEISVAILSKKDQHRIVSRLDSAFSHIDELKAKAEKQLSEAKALSQKALAEEMKPKEGWEEKTLKEICKVINGRAYAKDEMLKEGKYRLLRVGNFFTNDSWYYSDLELDEDKYCDKGDLLYAWSASFGPRIWDGEKVIFHYHIWKMICSSEIEKHFMFYWLDSDELKKQTRFIRQMHS
ncbi:MAG: restriction endonuclease subunit S [Bacteroidaceae bacterium]|nr:restriction endonuclease subunit S [Bacteroidaceae bacterium]